MWQHRAAWHSRCTSYAGKGQKLSLWSVNIVCVRSFLLLFFFSAQCLRYRGGCHLQRKKGGLKDFSETFGVVYFFLLLALAMLAMMAMMAMLVKCVKCNFHPAPSVWDTVKAWCSIASAHTCRWWRKHRHGFSCGAFVLDLCQGKMNLCWGIACTCCNWYKTGLHINGSHFIVFSAMVGRDNVTQSPKVSFSLRAMLHQTRTGRIRVGWWTESFLFEAFLYFHIKQSLYYLIYYVV